MMEYIEMTARAEEVMFEPGDPIVPMGRPFVKVLHNAQKGRLCDCCLKPGELRRCVNCKMMHYCGRICQRQDWKEGHALECRSEVFRNPEGFLGEAVVDKEILPKLLRLLAKFHLSPGSFKEKYKVYGRQERSFFDMMVHEECILEHKPTTSFLSKLTDTLQHEDSSFGVVEFNEKFIRRIFGVWKINAFAIMNEEEPIASGLYIAHSAINHSCRPNAVLASNGDMLEIRSINTIWTWEEPTISYLAGNRTLKERQNLLRSRYNFTCNCELCIVEESGPIIDYSQLQPLFHQLTYYFVIRDQGLKLFRKLYHEYDPRITNFCFLAFKTMYQFHISYQDVPKPFLRNAAIDVEKRLKITFGQESNDYGKFQRMLNELGIDLAKI